MWLLSVQLIRKLWYYFSMQDTALPRSNDQRLREIAAYLRDAFAVPADLDITLADLTLALDSPELAAIFLEIRALKNDEIARLERLLSRVADNDP